MVSYYILYVLCASMTVDFKWAINRHELVIVFRFEAFWFVGTICKKKDDSSCLEEAVVSENGYHSNFQPLEKE